MCELKQNSAQKGVGLRPSPTKTVRWIIVLVTELIKPFCCKGRKFVDKSVVILKLRF